MVNEIRFEGRLEGAPNFLSSKLRLMMTIREQELDSYVEDVVLIPDDEIERTLWKKNNNRAMKF